MSCPQSDQICAIVSTALGYKHWLRPTPVVTLDSLLVEELCCDAIDIVCIMVKVEEDLGFDISDAAAESWKTVSDILASVRALRAAA